MLKRSLLAVVDVREGRVTLLNETNWKGEGAKSDMAALRMSEASKDLNLELLLENKSGGVAVCPGKKCWYTNKGLLYIFTK